MTVLIYNQAKSLHQSEISIRGMQLNCSNLGNEKKICELCVHAKGNS